MQIQLGELADISKETSYDEVCARRTNDGDTQMIVIND